MRLEDTALLVLAAGLSSRFDDGDKLMADLAGKPVCAHVARALGDLPFAQKLAVAPQNSARAEVFAAAGFQIIWNTAPEAGQGASLALGVSALGDVAGVLVTLADTPFVEDGTCRALCAAIGEASAAICVSDGVRSPPVLFASALFDRLQQLDGDAGARRVLADCDDVVELSLSKTSLFDIDTHKDLERAKTLMEHEA